MTDARVKKRIDAGALAGSFWLTGSQPFRLMKLAGESLAGRVAVLPLSSLSQHKPYDTGEPQPLQIDLASLKTREKAFTPTDLTGIYLRIFCGAMPAVASGAKSHTNIFYSSYVQTYIERDVRDLARNCAAALRALCYSYRGCVCLQKTGCLPAIY